MTFDISSREEHYKAYEKKYKASMESFANSMAEKFFDEMNKKLEVDFFPGGGWICFSTPFLNHDGDNICVYAKCENDEVVFSDDGETITNYMLGAESLSKARRIANRYDVILDEKQCSIILKSDFENSGKMFIKFLNALLAFELQEVKY